LSAVLHSPVHAPWVGELQEKAKALLAKNSSSLLFSAAVREEIAKARELLKLSPLPQDAPLWP